ncbi:nonribosomal peptide synthase [Aspergillus vadensis CBS 113365]|uniref:Nonribosomal peptide synthase n=1 Tax=Aspergillus vadensis (strain CBS 113365 / IMI 142717 / IBT 24658) TaxID=1448311 RepID=A0A319BB08_ASPVC|nr:nonribosomal peptide synthase [Aspergillus vadensis CBS 113365]PYH69054.1 nonribosomal peptide synthase [Aspergillus vadensis CBS 113365]
MSINELRPGHGAKSNKISHQRETDQPSDTAIPDTTSQNGEYEDSHKQVKPSPDSDWQSRHCPRRSMARGDISDEDIRLLYEWNSQIKIPGVHTCIHTLIQQQCAKRPASEAVCAWDGTLSYYELNQLSNGLAKELQTAGIQPEMVVPVCYEKSRWTIVAILAVLKAGGAFVLLDPSYPEARLADIYADVEAQIIISSPSNQNLSTRLGQNAHTLVVTDSKISSLCSTDFIVAGPSIPENAAYIAYTSGSTGKPKGIVVEHRSFLASVLAHSEAQKFNADSRVMQFASYGFDISIQEMLAPLIVGGCVCVPSESQRLDHLAPAIRQLRANWLELTPSVAKSLAPEAIPNVKTLVLGGESLHLDDVSTWAQHVQLLVAYGPAECSIVSTVQSRVEGSDPYNIGRSYGGQCWVVNPENHDRLQPLGETGELVVSGPIVARGYRNRPEEQAFIERPPWASLFGLSSDARFYKTGDLVKYKVEDGTLRFVGRKDLQVKVNGQRIELQEIEHCARELRADTSAIADVLPTKNTKILTLFVQVGEDTSSYPSMSDFQAWLSERLPPFMVPTLYLPWKRFPLGPTGKVDRRLLLSQALQELAEAPSRPYGEELADQEDTEPLATICSLFKEVLGLRQERPVSHSPFFALGGTSILAIALAAKARERGLSLSAAEVLLHQTPIQLALVVRKYEVMVDPTPFALISDVNSTVEAASCQCQVPREHIEDIYPCTPLQEGLVSLSSKSPDSFVGRFVFRLSKSVDLERFRSVCEAIVAVNPIYRTRIVQLEDGRLLQVVVKGPAGWTADCRSMSTNVLGSPLCSFQVADDEQSSVPLFILTLHHAVFDGWSYSQLLGDIDDGYKSVSVPPRASLSRFVKYISEINKSSSMEFWSREFRDLEAPVFPACPPGWVRPGATASITRQVRLHGHPDAHGSTLANKIKLSWAIVMSSRTNSNDVVFGTTVSGRTAPVDGVERMAGPAIASYPLRVRLQPSASVQETLDDIQALDSRTVLFEQTGLQHIRRVSSEASLACSFQSMLVIQPKSLQVEGTLLHDTPGNQEEQLKFNSHVLTVIPQLGPGAVDIMAVYDEAVLPSREIESLLEQLETVLRQVVSNQTTRLDALQTHSQSDRQQLQIWNHRTPVDIDALLPIHERIAIFARKHPYANAICSWDGSFMYHELYERSRSLAGFLQTIHGTGPGMVVGVFMEKTKWFPVAVLGIMMSGAAFVLLDILFPSERLQYMMQVSDAKIVICSPSTEARCSKITDQLVVLEEGGCTTGDKYDNYNRPLVSGHDTMYVQFTSGSTGTPKGVAIEHGMAHSTLSAHKELSSMGPATRTLWFSSPAWDATVWEVVFILAAGGCICIPSDEQRLNDLEGAIAVMEVNSATLTPSVARTLSPPAIPTLRTLILAGEATSPSDLQKWFPRVELHVAYGPAECTIATTIHRVTQLATDSTIIGRPPAATCWIVRPDNHNQLQPVGVVGELVVGGPTVARGYLHRPKETALAFVRNVSWASEFCLGEGTLYKTGDLARFNPDGSLSFVGRKDNQVKVRGQRLELGEIEHCAQQFMPNIEVAADLVSFQHSLGSKVVLYVCFRQVDAKPSLGDNEASLLFHPSDSNKAEMARLREHLHHSLPPYMVPWILVPTRYIPLSPSGKTDRRPLKKQICELKRKDLETYLGANYSKRAPSTELEARLQKLYARVLSLPETAIGVDDSFFTLGGDSISAMQLLSLARKADIPLSMQEFLTHNTIAQFCENAQLPRGDTLLNNLDAVDEEIPFKLSPIQSLIFPSASMAEKRFNQTFLVKVNRQVNMDDWNRVLHQIVHHHAMLRTRLVVGESGDLRLTYQSAAHHSLRIREHHVARIEQARVLAEESHNCLDLRTGPVLSLDLIHTPKDGDYALFVGHHMVVDLVSWRIILDDIEEFLEGHDPSMKEPVSFAKWVQFLETECRVYSTPQEVLPFEVRPANYDYWGLSPKHNTYGDAECHEFTVDEATTHKLLGPANVTWNSQPQEIFQAALLHSWARTFKDRETPTIFSEGHGREAGRQGIDLSRTVGWFTIVRPCTVEDSTASLGLRELVRRVKDVSRSLPNNGLAYFSSRYLKPEFRSAFAGHDRMEILFNYSGRYQQLERPGALFSHTPLQLDERLDVGADMPRQTLFDVAVDVRNGCLRVQVWYSGHTHRKPEIGRWISAYQQSLHEAAVELIDKDSQLTLSDIPLAPLRYSELDLLQEKIKTALRISSVSSIESIYPCSDAHCGLVTGITGTASRHRVQSILEITVSDQGVIEPARVAKAWRELSRRHATLRTVLVEHPGRQGKFLSVVLKLPSLDVTVLPSCYSFSDTLQQLRELPPRYSWDISPSQQMAVGKTSDDRTLCKLSFGKGFIDATSMDVLLSELASILREEDLSPKIAPSYGAYISHLQAQDRANQMQHWIDLLAACQPCLLPGDRKHNRSHGQLRSKKIMVPNRSGLDRFLKSHQLTLTNVFQVAWALVLRHYTDRNEVCFATLLSGRDLPLPEIQKLVGSCFNVLPCFLRLSQSRTLLDVLRENQREMNRRMANQHCSLPEILSRAGHDPKGFFNTCLTVQSAHQACNADQHSQDGIKVKVLEVHDPTEYDICIAVMVSPSHIEIDFRYWTSFCSGERATEILTLLSSYATRMALHGDDKIEPLEMKAIRLADGCNGSAGHVAAETGSVTLLSQ